MSFLLEDRREVGRVGRAKGIWVDNLRSYQLLEMLSFCFSILVITFKSRKIKNFMKILSCFRSSTILWKMREFLSNCPLKAFLYELYDYSIGNCSWKVFIIGNLIHVKNMMNLLCGRPKVFLFSRFECDEWLTCKFFMVGFN